MARARKSISKYGQLADTVQEAMPLARQAFLDTVPAVSLILDWLAYGPVLDTSKHVASVAPRPVLIIGASDDERTPADQAELLFDAARNPKRLRSSDGLHIQSNRQDVIEELRRIADEEQSFLTQ